VRRNQFGLNNCFSPPSLIAHFGSLYAALLDRKRFTNNDFTDSADRPTFLVGGPESPGGTWFQEVFEGEKVAETLNQMVE
jgi:hypothetical protein